MPITVAQAKSLVQQVLAEITGDPQTREERYPNLRSVEAKVREVRIALEEVGASQLVAAIDSDEGFMANSRRVRLEQLDHHCKMAIRFLDQGVIKTKQSITRAPDVSKLTQVLPELDAVIQERWIEAQRCQYAKAYTAAVIMMGSVLEALLLSRCQLRPAEAYQSPKAPKDKQGQKPIHEWNLHALVEVAVERGWLKTDRGSFSHALRESRNIVHPWEHARSRANFDESTCTTCWIVLKASVNDLIASV